MPAAALPPAAAANAPAGCVSDADKRQCDKDYEDDLDRCHDDYASGLRGAGFKSAWRACLDHAERRRNACYKGDPDPGPFNAGPWKGGRKR